MTFLVKYSYLFLLYPVFVLWYVVSQETAEPFMPERLLFLHILLYAVAFFLPFRILKSAYIITIYLLNLTLIFFEAGYVYLYKEELTSSVIFILLETNASEAKEYLHVYFTAPVIRLLLLFLVPSILILVGVVRAIYHYPQKSYGTDVVKLCRKFGKLLLAPVPNSTQAAFLRGTHFFNKLNSSVSSNKFPYKWTISILVFTTAITTYIKADHFKHHILYAMSEGYEQYKGEIEKYKHFLSNSENSPYINSVEFKNDNKNETMVIIIGESTTKHHMGIYGYYRNTTPNLKSMDNELLIFDDVISPHSHTIESLEKVLTFGSTANPDAKEKGTMVQLAKAAGYKTYWISNQSPIGLYETLLTMIAKTADQSFFINTGSTTEKKSYFKKSYDEKLFPFIERVLNDSEPKKLVFVHLYGTHASYNSRYPADFKVFNDHPQTDFPSERAYDAINSYDNAVLYNDFVVSHIINILKQTGTEEEEKQLLYFSDHGEEVFQSMDFEGHTESIGTYPMFEIPFIYWTNEEDKSERFRKYTNRSYMTDNLIYSVADLLSINFNGRDNSKSLFSPKYKPQQRIVKQNIDFDKEIKP